MAGPIIGGILLPILGEILQPLAGFRLILYGLVLILMIRFLPLGHCRRAAARPGCIGARGGGRNE